ncbi:MAG: DUF362 domain-containing protein [Actinobacteria bacterium]|nr:DUF362 domain-containing protein [Actinomycetota bacterium]
MSSDVFFADARSRSGNNLFTKIKNLFEAANLKDVFKKDDFVALKVHFGEPGNLGYVKPNLIRQIVEKIKEYKAHPFLTDTNTLYVGQRSNAINHIKSAIENGFAYSVVNAPIIIADGLTGKEYYEVEINQNYFKTVKIGGAIHHSDSIIVVSHFKGHEATGFGGTLKNLGMGSGSRSGKQMMHSDILPTIEIEKCNACAKCIRWCPANAIQVFKDNNQKYAKIDEKKCIGCGECTVTCNYRAIAINWKEEADVLQKKIVEYAYGVLKNKENQAGYFNFLLDITPDCDCTSWNDIPFVNDIGIMASKDPVAIDQAGVDIVNQKIGLEGRLTENLKAGEDKFRSIHKNINWEVQLEYAEKLKLGSRKYNLIEV